MSLQKEPQSLGMTNPFLYTHILPSLPTFILPPRTPNLKLKLKLKVVGAAFTHQPFLCSRLSPRLHRMDLLGQVAVSLVSAAAATAFIGFFTLGLALVVQPAWMVRWLQRRIPNVLYLKETKERVVSLTIDDGPHKEITPKILKILRENDCRATWFIIGSNMDLCPGLVEQIHNEGHELGNHTMFDVASWKLPLDAFEEQLIEVDRRLNSFYHKDASGNLLKWFRPGHGFYTKRLLAVAEAHGYRLALGSLFPLDTMFTNQGKHIGEYLLRRVYPGAVIILHDREPQKFQTIKVLEILLPELRRRGYRVVTLSELVGKTFES